MRPNQPPPPPPVRDFAVPSHIQREAAPVLGLGPSFFDPGPESDRSCASCRFFGSGRCHVDPPQLRQEVRGPHAPPAQVWDRPPVGVEDPACDRWSVSRAAASAEFEEYKRRWHSHYATPGGSIVAGGALDERMMG